MFAAEAGSSAAVVAILLAIGGIIANLVQVWFGRKSKQDATEVSRAAQEVKANAAEFEVIRQTLAVVKAENEYNKNELVQARRERTQIVRILAICRKNHRIIMNYLRANHPEVNLPQLESEPEVEL